MNNSLLQNVNTIRKGKQVKQTLTLFMFLIGFGSILNSQTIDHWETVFYNDAMYSYYTNVEGTASSDWRDIGFDDSAWRTGNGGIGNGDGDDNTVIEQCISVFMRTKFTVTDLSTIVDGVLHVDYDDAFVAFLNGVEIARSAGLSQNFPYKEQLSSVNHEAKMYSGGNPEVFALDEALLKQLLVVGENVMAIQVHNVTANSSDMSSNTFFSVGLSTSASQFSPTPDWFFLPYVYDGSTLPLIIIDTDGQSIPDEPKITATMKVISNNSGLINHPSDTPNEYEGYIGIEIRGATSAGYPQKPYSLETRDEFGEDLNVPLLGMPDESDWVLLSHYNEKSFMRNMLSYHMFQKMGHYATRSRLVDVMINGKYEGIYLFGEKVKRDKNRIDLKKLKPEEISGVDMTGGYIFKVDYASSNDSWASDYSPIDHPDYETRFVYYYPDYDKIVPEQKLYIKDAVDAFQYALHQSDFGQTYENYIDVTSFIDYFLVSEISRNVDGYKKSRYFNKDREDINSLIHAGPVWDFDWAWKNIYDCQELRNKVGAGWAYKVNDCIRTYSPGWYVRLLQDQGFADKVKCRYTSLRETSLSLDSIYAFMDSIYNIVIIPQENHYRRWDILGTNTGAPEMDPPSQTYDEEFNRLKDWIATRLTWLDANMMGSDDNCDVTAINDKQEFNFKVYPNPATQNIYIESEKMIKQIEIFDITGKLVLTDNSGSKFNWQLSIDGLPKGLYFIKSFLDNQQVIVRKVIVE